MSEWYKWVTFIRKCREMKRIVKIIVLILVVGQTQAQNDVKVIRTIRGIVVDAATSEPVSYTNIGLEDTYYGTASNAAGNFELKIPAELASKNIYFSAVGFVNQKFPVSELFSKAFIVIKLEPQSYSISGVDVAAQSKVLIRILRMAAEDIPYNFVGGPFNLVCRYTNQKTIGDSVWVAQEADVLLFDRTGYSQPSKLDAFRSRKYSVKNVGSPAENYRFSTGATNIDELLELDWVRSGSSVLNPAFISGFNLKLKSEPVVDGEEFWVILFTQAVPDFASTGDFHASSIEGEITIAKEDYSVAKIEGKVQSNKNSFHGKSVAVGPSGANIREDVSYDFMVVYKSLKPELFRMNKIYTCNGEKVQEKSELKVNQIHTTQLNRLETRNYFPVK